jgi:glycerol kinase
VSGVVGDQQAALFGQTCFDEGDAKNTYGTGSFFLMNTGNEAVASEHGLLTTVGFQRSGEPVQYALEGSIFAAGQAIEWLRDVGLVRDTAEVGELARSVETTDGVYVVPSFAGQGAPHWNAGARGTVVGMSEDSRRAHVVRATLESVAYQTRDVAEAMEADAGVTLDQFRIDGGVASNDFFAALLADVVQSELLRPRVRDTTALGAVYAAGLAVDYWETLDDLRDHWRVDRAFEPRIDPELAADRYQEWQRAIRRAQDWAQGPDRLEPS